MATTGEGIAELLGRDRTVPRALEQRAAARRRQRQARIGSGSCCRSGCCSILNDVLPAGELDRLVDRITTREIDPYSVARRSAARALSPEAMKAILDHIGIAVEDIDDALAFYRDALDWRSSRPKRCRRSACALISFRRGERARTARSDRARFADREILAEARPGPAPHDPARGRHPRGARPPPHARRPAHRRAPRPGAQAALVAFIHPAAAHGVLVELKQAAPCRGLAHRQRLPFGRSRG